MRKLMVAIMLLLAVGGTVGAYAYWDDLERSNDETLTVGEGTRLEVIATASAPEGKTLVPKGVSAKETDVEEIVLAYEVHLDKQVLKDLYLYVSTENVMIGRKDIYSHLVNFDIEASSSTVNSETVNVKIYITLTEPADREEFLGIIGQNITFKVLFEATYEKRDTEPVFIEPVAPYVMLLGDENMTVELGSTFVEPGYLAYDSNGDLIENKWFSGYYHTWSVGSFELDYSCYSTVDQDHCDTVTRMVTVVDTTAPVIHFGGETVRQFTVGETYSSLTAWTSDVSNDVTLEILGEELIDMSQPGTYTVTYKATDSSNNETIEYVIVNVEEE